MYICRFNRKHESSKMKKGLKKDSHIILFLIGTGLLTLLLFSVFFYTQNNIENPFANYFSDIYVERGNSKLYKKDYKGARSDFNFAIYLNPRNSLAYNGRGNLKSDLKDCGGAIRDYNEAIFWNPKNSST